MPSYPSVHLTRVLKHILEVSITRSQTIQRVIALSQSTHESRQGIRAGSSSHAARSVNVGNIDLDRGVVFGGDEAAGS